MKTKIVAIVPAAGLGMRFSNILRKPFAKVADIPLLIYTLKRLHQAKSITEIIPVLRKEDMSRGLELIESYGLEKIKQIASGGKERQDSVYNALKLVEAGAARSRDDCLIFIHDGVRPLVSAKLIQELLKGIKGVDGVVPGLSVKETLKKINTKGFVISTVNRKGLWTVQTPQVFPFKVIKRAYDRACKDGFHATDDAALVERIGGRMKTIKGDPNNIKVTTPEDMDMVEYLLAKKIVSN